MSTKVQSEAISTAKLELASVITGIAQQENLTTVAISKIIGTSQPDASRLLRGEVERFSIDRLFLFLFALKHDVELIVAPSVDPVGSLRLVQR